MALVVPVVVVVVLVVAPLAVIGTVNRESRHERTLRNIARLERELGITASDDPPAYPLPTRQHRMRAYLESDARRSGEWHSPGIDLATVKANREWRKRLARYSAGRRPGSWG